MRSPGFFVPILTGRGLVLAAKGVTHAQGVYLQKRIDGAHKRFLQSVRTLELARRLAHPDQDASVNVEQRVCQLSNGQPPT
jgi:hypothetical protein